MARREELWTVEVGKRIAKLKRTREQIAGLAALAEHARAVRVVKQVVKHAAHMEQQTRVNREANAYWQGKLDGAENILAALTKGRA